MIDDWEEVGQCCPSAPSVGVRNCDDTCGKLPYWRASGALGQRCPTSRSEIINSFASHRQEKTIHRERTRDRFSMFSANETNAKLVSRCNCWSALRSHRAGDRTLFHLHLR